MTEQHFTELCQYERQLAGEGVRLIAGIDEAGRGPLAGPVAAACVIFPARGRMRQCGRRSESRSPLPVKLRNGFWSITFGSRK